MSVSRNQPTVVLLLGGAYAIDPGLAPLGLTIDDLIDRLSGGWFVGYMDSLVVAGIRPVLMCISEAVSSPERRRHQSTGATVWLLPPSRTCRLMRRFLLETPSWPHRALARWMRRLLWALVWHCPYLTTPVVHLARTLRRERCEILLCENYETSRFDLAVLIGLLLHIRVFATYQGAIPSTARQVGDHITHGLLGRSTRLEHLVRGWSVRAADGLLVGAEIERHRVQLTYAVPARRLHSIANPVPIPAPTRPSRRAEARRALGVGTDDTIITWVGRIDIWQKGLDVLVDAWEQCCRARPDLPLRLLIVGAGPDEADLERRIAAAGVSNIHWYRKFVLDRSVIELYHDAADIYAFPSRHEGFAVAPIEAMAAGVPVVAARAPGIPDLFGQDDVGLLVPVGDRAAFANALGRLIDDPASARTMGDRARVRVAQCFSIEVVAGQLSSVFRASEFH